MPGRLWFVVPAAGASRRVGAATPKQYLDLLGRTVLEHSLRVLLSHAGVAGGVVALAAHDEGWSRLPAGLRSRVWTARGGEERCHSVLAGLAALAGAGDDDWVLVHDAARPCLAAADLERLVATCRDDAVGGLLAVPVADTVKRAGADGRVAETVRREGLWRAQTPQMFRLGLLRRALESAIGAGEAPADEATAVERLGLRPLLVEGSPFNIKITHPADLEFAARVLVARAQEAP